MKHTASSHILTFGLLISLIGNLVPLTARATVLEVPVSTGLDSQVSSIDQSATQLLAGFTQYTKDFRSAMIDGGSSIRDVLAGNPNPRTGTFLFNPGKSPTAGGGKSTKPENACSMRQITDPNKSKPIGGGAWEELVAKGNGAIETSFSDTKVNDSGSLTCLLQEIVEQNKLSLNLQIHQLLNEHIQAAQAKAFAGSQQNIIMAANIDWVRQANVRTTKDDEGNVIESKSFNALSHDLKNDTMERAGTAFARGILGDPNAAQFSIGDTIDRFQLGRTALMSANSAKTSKREKAIASLTCNITGTIQSGGLGFESIEQYQRFRMGDINARGASYVDTVNAIAANPQCTQSGAEDALRLALDEQYSDIESEDAADRLANNGFSSSRKCKEDSPDCSETEIVAAGSSLGTLNNNALTATERKLENVKDEKDLIGYTEGESISISMRTEGINGFDTSKLKGTTAGETVASFYEAIKNGYFDLQGGTTDWALGAMMQIYDHSLIDQSRYAPGSGSIGATPTAAATPPNPAAP